MVTKTTTPPMTAEEFFDWANRPENEGKRYELDQGEVVEMPSPGEAHALVCWFVIKLLTEYLVRLGRGHLLTNDCGLIVRRRPDTVRGPDVMLFLDDRTLAEANIGHVDRVPQLVVEVFSPSDRPGKLGRRIRQYHERGVPLVWVVFPQDRTVNVYRPAEALQDLGETDTLTGSGVLPDFTCPVSHLFTLTGASPPAAP